MGAIVLGNGSNDVLELVALAFLGPGRAAVFSQHCFAVYPLATQARGARSIVVPAKNFGHDLEAMAKAIDDETYVVWIANPNNPTGTFARHEEIEAFLKRVPERVLVVLDEAYNEYLPAELRGDSVKLLKRHPNLVVTRTFSKAYGLAGLRVGYALAHPSVADVMNRVRQPFNVNSIALAAARAALDDMEFVARSYAENLQGLKHIEEGSRALGLDYIPSHGNFITVRVGKAPEIYKRLLRRGVIVRPVGGGYGLPEHLRVTIGTAEENERFLSALAASLGRNEARRHRRRTDRRFIRPRAEAGEDSLDRWSASGRNAANLKLALERGIIDAIAPDPAAAARDADLVLVATPVAQFPAVFASLAESKALITDGGSTKRDVIAAARKALGKRIRALRARAPDRRRREKRRRRCQGRAVPGPRAWC